MNTQAKGSETSADRNAKRHNWQAVGGASIAYRCTHCGLTRWRPQSAIRRGRMSVSDWAYSIGGEVKRLQRVPTCEFRPATAHELNEKAGAREDYRFERSLCEALNSGNGSYQP